MLDWDSCSTESHNEALRNFQSLKFIFVLGTVCNLISKSVI
jgi:hypothetical protein